MICREGAWASSRSGGLRCLRLTAPEGTRQNDSGAQRMGNYFCFVVAGEVADPEEEGGGSIPLPWGTGQGISPGAPARDLFGLERAISKGPILTSKGPFSVPKDYYGCRGNFDSRSPFYTVKREISVFCGTFFSFRSPS